MSDQEAMTRSKGQWVGAFFEDVDKLDLPTMMKWFADDIELRIGNQPPARGYAAVEQSFAEFLPNLSGMAHQPIELFVSEDDRGAAQMATVSYTRKGDGKVVTLPVATHLRRNAAGKFDRLWIYIDINPLFAE